MRYLVIPLVLALGLVLLRFSRPYDIDPGDQAKQANYVVSAVNDGQWVLPKERGELLPTKPPLYTWLGAAAGLVLGVTDTTVRIPAAVAALLLVLATIWAGRMLAGPRLGARAAIVVAASFFFFRLSAWVRTDMLHAALISVAIVLFLRHRIGPGPSRRFVVLAWVAMGLGTLAKTPLALVLPLLITLVDRRLRREGPAYRTYFPPLGVALYLAIVLAWLVPALVEGGRPFLDVMTGEFVTRAADASDRGSQVQPWWFFLPVLIGWCLPWSLWLPAATVRAFRRGRTGVTLLPLVWFIAVMTVFSLSSGKRQDYILPVLPAVGLLVASLFPTEPRAGADRDGLRATTRVAAVGTAVVGLAVLLFIAGPLRPILARHTGDLAALASERPLEVAAHAVALLVGAAGLWWGSRRTFRTSVVMASGVLVFLSGAVAQQVTLADVLAPGPRYRDFVFDVLRETEDGALEVYRVSNNATYFYLGRTRPALRTAEEAASFLAGPGRRYLLTHEHAASKLSEETGLTFRLVLGPGPTIRETRPLVLVEGAPR